MNDDKYYLGENNIPYCKKCNAPLQYFNKEKNVFLPRSCDCRKKHFESIEKERIFKEEQKQFKKLQDASMLGERYKSVNFKNSQRISSSFISGMNRCMQYCDDADNALKKGEGLYIYGSSGTGKTHLTACICNELTAQQKHCLFTNFFEISKAIRNTYNNKESDSLLIKKICDIDFLFIDDIGTERLRSNGEDNWLQEQVFDIVNKRYNNMKPIIYTSNHSINQLVQERGLMEKTADRINETSRNVIKLEGESYRQRKANENALSDRLGKLG